MGYSEKSQSIEGNGPFFKGRQKKLKRTRKKTKILHAVKISFRNAGEIKTFSGKEKQFFTSIPTLTNDYRKMFLSRKEMFEEATFKHREGRKNGVS